MLPGVKLKDDKHIQADLVVEASGSSSKMAEWLQQLGHALPPTLTVDAGLRYTARIYDMPEDPDRLWTTAVCGTSPKGDISAVLMPIETNKWQASWGGKLLSITVRESVHGIVPVAICHQCSFCAV